MTGFGRAAADIERPGRARTRWLVEIRSVNHRGFDLKVRSPESEPALEVELARLIRAAVERGAVTLGIREERPTASGLDVDVIRDTVAALDQIRREAQVSVPIDLATVAAFLALDAGAAGVGLRNEEAWPALRTAVEKALVELVASREVEGAALRKDFLARTSQVAKLVEAIEEAAKAVPPRFARRLKERLASLHDAPGFDAARVAQEIALLAERLDVSEELVRLRTHLAHLTALFDEKGPVGRKLDFVLQEISREVNTIGSKAQDAEIAGQVIECKAELEKIREQAQNIE
ncbi:MAG TPA: YicC/YloC family endoribonuclease [Polyangia bacterium]|jgi:uncharacterized protein (TIGR00255 family)